MIFDKVIKPILLYACEIWGKNEKIGGEIADMGKTIWEGFHIRACKNLIGAHKRAPNLATLAEIGRYPINIEIHKRMIRHLLRSKNIEEERLLYSAFTEKLSNKTNNWIEMAKEIVDNTGHSYMFQMATNRNNINEIKDVKSLSNKVQKREKEIFEQKLFCHLENKKAKKEGKLVFYANLKQTFGQED